MNENKTETMSGFQILTFLFRWAFGFRFLLNSMDSILKHSFIAAVFFFLAAIISIPLTASVLEYKYNFQMPGFIRFFVVFVLVIIASFLFAVSTYPEVNSADPKTEIKIIENPTTEINISKTPDETPLVEYLVSDPYSPGMDSWMKKHAQKHRTSNEEELHLFTFSDGKQFEYYMPAARSRYEGTINSASWVKESNDHLLEPVKISDQQFQQNMQSILSHYNSSLYELKPDETSGEILYVYLGEIFATMEQYDEASILKNYIDLKPDRSEYTIAIVSPMAAKDVKDVCTLKFTPQNNTLVEENSVFPDAGKKSSTVWYDATYTTIVNAIEKYDFTNNPGKVGHYYS